MFTWIWEFLLYSRKIETLFPKLEYQKLQTIQLKQVLRAHCQLPFYAQMKQIFHLELTAYYRRKIK